LKLYLYRDYDTPALLSLAQALSRLNSLCAFDLSLCSSNQITLESINQSLFQLQNLPSLSSLRLHFSSLNLPSSLIANVGPTLKTLTALTSLKLDFLDLAQTKDKEIIMLSKSLASLISLTDKSLESVASSLKGLTLLKSFSLHIFNGESIGNKGVKALTRALSSLKNLETLGLGFHDNKEIDQKGLDGIATALENLPKLFKISLNLMKCKGLVTPNQMYRNLLRVIKDKRNIQ